MAAAYQSAIQQLHKRLHAAAANPSGRLEKTAEIYDAVLLESRMIEAGNFEAVETADLERLFELYDDEFLDGACRRVARGFGNTLSFRWSPRMTSAAGKTFQRRSRRQRGPAAGYEIAISTTLLFETFRDDWRPITVSGVACRDRLQALQRIFEHELLHLLEMLLWDDSSCAQPRFRKLATDCFGHSASTHALLTPREIAQQRYQIRAGTAVEFVCEGVRLQGIVNRVTKRATVLVPDPRGEQYSDGKTYAKYYVPLHLLQPLDS